jgi:hypothetical protein
MLPTSTVCSPLVSDVVAARTHWSARTWAHLLSPPGDTYHRMRAILATRLDPVRFSVSEVLALRIHALSLAPMAK